MGKVYTLVLTMAGQAVATGHRIVQPQPFADGTACCFVEMAFNTQLVSRQYESGRHTIDGPGPRWSVFPALIMFTSSTAPVS